MTPSKFDLDIFRDSENQNLQLLLTFFDERENVMDSFANINGITEEELEEVDDDLEEDNESYKEFNPARPPDLL